jgi:hypothetical protein
MTSEESLWYRLGYALEGAKVPDAPPKAEEGGTRRPRRRRPAPATESGGGAGDELVTAGLAAVAARLLDAWQPRRDVGFKRLLWAGASGAAAALLLDLVKPILRGEPELPALDRETADRLLAGVGLGLIYGAVVEPRVPGPPLLKGALFGSADYAAEAAGGLTRLLSAHAPQSRLPFVGRIFGDSDPHDGAYLEHLAFGITLALLYGSSPSSNGTTEDDAEE